MINDSPTQNAGRLRWFPLAALVLIACFGKVLADWARFAYHDPLYSHMLLVPFISGYLVWIEREKLSAKFAPAPRLALLTLFLGAGTLWAYWLAWNSGRGLPMDDCLAFLMVAFVCFTASICCFLAGRAILPFLAFPLCFLLFMAPFPVPIRDAIESFFQHTSAWMANQFFNLTGAPVLKSGLVFVLPSLQPLQVAPECSGVHSSLVLFITSLIAGQLMLRSPWKRAFLTLFVIPLAIVRNGFRIFVIAELCMHIGPQMIDSPIHHHGGPLFFLLSLVPFFAVLLYLVRAERRARGSTQKNGGSLE